jgi:hypothetical protein
MPNFKCTKCGCLENTAVSGYSWTSDKSKVLCSQCDPQIGKWHNYFERIIPENFFIANDGFLYHIEEIESEILDFRIENNGFLIIKPAW